MRSRHLRCRATRSTGEGKTHCRKQSRKIAVGGISSEIKTIPARPTRTIDFYKNKEDMYWFNCISSNVIPNHNSLVNEVFIFYKDILEIISDARAAVSEKVWDSFLLSVSLRETVI